VTFYARRERFSRCQTAVGARLSRLPLTANGWTLLGVALGLSTVAALAAGSLLAAGVLYALAGVCDLADGAVARQRGSASPRGAYLDTLADRAVEAAPLFGLLTVPLPALALSAAQWLFLNLFLGLMGTYAKAAATEKGLAEREMAGGGLLEHPERVILLAAGLVAGHLHPALLVWALALLAALGAVSLIQRIRLALRASRRPRGRP